MNQRAWETASACATPSRNGRRERWRRGRADPDAYFAERGMVLICGQRGTQWAADPCFPDEGRKALVGYGIGDTEAAATVSALERWLVEQDAPDLRRRPGDPLP
jgi:hypothetical protein